MDVVIPMRTALSAAIAALVLLGCVTQEANRGDVPNLRPAPQQYGPEPRPAPQQPQTAPPQPLKPEAWTATELIEAVLAGRDLEGQRIKLTGVALMNWEPSASGLLTVGSRETYLNYVIGSHRGFFNYISVWEVRRTWPLIREGDDFSAIVEVEECERARMWDGSIGVFINARPY